MKKKKILIPIIICLSAYAVFATVIATLFHIIQNDPIDKIAMPYIWSDVEIPNEYGEIIHIGRNIIHKTEKNETSIRAPYTVETEKGVVTVYVNLEKSDETWKAVSIEVMEVRLDEQ